MIWIWLVVAWLVLGACAIPLARRDYRLHARLRPFAFAVFTAWFFVPHLTVEFAARKTWPGTPTEYVGLPVAILGALLCLASIVSFRSLPKVFAADAGTLTVGGIYRWSRNPQYVGWFVFVLGFTVMWWRPWCLLALALLALSIHVIVLTEEEHLRRVFGAAYESFRARTARYLGRPRSRI